MITENKTEDSIEYLKIDSSMISNASYHKESNVLIIKFNRGGSYEYHPVSNNLFEQFKKAESQGKFFIKNIKNNENIVTTKLN